MNEVNERDTVMMLGGGVSLGVVVQLGWVKHTVIHGAWLHCSAGMWPEKVLLNNTLVTRTVAAIVGSAS